MFDYNTSMKTCTICKEIKNEDKFFYKNKKAEKLHSQCKDCYVLKRRAIWKAHYHKYGSNYRERAIERNKRLKQKLRENLLDYLSDKKCASCGIGDPRVLEFDHLDPKTKSFGISQALHGIINWDTILIEINKCQILCANCHKIKTSTEQGWYKSKIIKSAP